MTPTLEIEEGDEFACTDIRPILLPGDWDYWIEAFEIYSDDPEGPVEASINLLAIEVSNRSGLEATLVFDPLDFSGFLFGRAPERELWVEQHAKAGRPIRSLRFAPEGAPDPVDG